MSEAALKQRSDLILEYLPRVRWIAAHIHARLPGAVALEDLVSVGVLGLIAAVDNFKTGFNVKLSTYADYRIRGAILDSIRGLDGVPAHKRARMKTIRRAMAGAAQRIGAMPDEEAVAAELGIPLAEYHEWLLDVRPVAMWSLDWDFAAGSQTVRLAEIVAGDRAACPDRLLEEAELRELVDHALSCLPPVQYTVMHCYYREGMRIARIASLLHLHTSRVWQIKVEATGRVRKIVRDGWIPGRRRAGGAREEALP